MRTPETQTLTDFEDESLDRALDVLAHPSRRTIIEELADNGRTSVGSLAELLADGDRAKRRKKIQLVHCHLPKLAETDAVAYDHDERIVEPGSEVTKFATSLEFVESE